MPLFKRVVAVVLLLCFGSFSLEALIADVHDGDASAAEVATTSGALGARDVGPEAATGADRGASAVLADEHGDGPLRAPAHERHACHCVHAHTCSVSQAAPMPGVPGMRTASISHVLREPSQVVVLQPLRPPIA